jgi:hypothetical protein
MATAVFAGTVEGVKHLKGHTSKVDFVNYIKLQPLKVKKNK